MFHHLEGPDHLVTHDVRISAAHREVHGIVEHVNHRDGGRAVCAEDAVVPAVDDLALEVLVERDLTADHSDPTRDRYEAGDVKALKAHDRSGEVRDGGSVGVRVLIEEDVTVPVEDDLLLRVERTAGLGPGREVVLVELSLIHI